MDLSVAGLGHVAAHREAEPYMQAFASAHGTMTASGAVFKNGLYEIGEERVRVVQAAGMALSSIRAEVEAMPAMPSDLDVILCAGAIDDGDATPSVVRGSQSASIMRGGSLSVKFITDVKPLVLLEG